MEPFVRAPGASPEPDNAVPERAILIDIFRQMARLKANDDKLFRLVKSGQLAIPFFSWRGQEAIPAGTFVALRRDDYLCTIYRGLHDSIVKGVPLDQLWAELFGRVTGSCRGKGGPMHITHPACGVMVTTGVVGSSMPIATGLAWASQIKGDGRVTVATFGDGASNIGAFHEALNLASIWRLPVIFLCSNNGYGEHTRFSKSTSVARVADRASAYSMPGVSIDGNDPVAVYNAISTAAKRARAGEGPTLVEAITFRFRGHIFGDNDHYMLEGEKEEWLGKDPYPRFRTFVLGEGAAVEDELAKIEAEAVEEVDCAVDFAMNSPLSDIAELNTDILEVQP